MTNPMTPAQQYLEWIEWLGGEATQGDLFAIDYEIGEETDLFGPDGVPLHFEVPSADAALIVALYNSREAVGRVIRAAVWARKAHKATKCPDDQCTAGVISYGPSDDPQCYECEWCAMREEIGESLDALPVEASDAEPEDIATVAATDISNELVARVREFLGPDGIEDFRGWLEEHDTVSPVLTHDKIPHSVHFREGMQVRNFMRHTGLA